ARGGRRRLGRCLAAEDLAHGLRVRLEALDLPAAGRGEGLPQVDQGLRLVDVSAPDRDEDAEDRAEDQPSHGQPPASGDPVPGRAQVDLALRVGVHAASLRPNLAHGAGNLAATHSQWARSPSASSVVGAHPSSARAFATSARVRRTSPTAAPCRSIASSRPATRSARAIASLIHASSPPPPVYTSPAAPLCIPAIVPATASATYVKLRDTDPSPKSLNGVPAASASSMGVKAMSSVWRVATREN